MSHRFDILIAGDSLAAWMSALAFRRWLPDRTIAVVPYHGEDSRVADPVVVARPSFRSLMPALGLSEADLVTRCDATFLVGTEHRHWRDDTATFLQALGSFGAPANGAAFHHYYQRISANGQSLAFGAFSLAACMARRGVFAHPSPNPRALESSFDYCLALDGEAFRSLMRGRASETGVERLNSPVMGTAWSDGRIQHLLLEEGAIAEADFYLDCTGPARGLTGAAGWVSLGGMGFVRESQSVGQTDGNLSLAITGLTEDGWYRETALRSRRARERFRRLEDGGGRCGYLDTPWRGNCLALGRAACDLPALNTPAFSLLERELSLLAGLLPVNPADMSVEVREYNRRARTAYAHMRDTQTLFELAAARRLGHPAPVVSDTLARKLEQFVSRGRMVMYDEEVLTESEWIAWLLGLGYRPERVSPLALGAPVEAVRQNYLKLASRIEQSAVRLPDQQTYIAHLLSEFAREASPNAV